MKNVIITFSINNGIEDLTIDSIKNYGKRVGCEVFVMKSAESWYERVGEYLLKYDRVAFISPYILVREDAENLFDIVPPGMLGAYNEGRYVLRGFQIKQAVEYYGEKLKKEWTGKYYSTDVLVASKKHRDLFRKTTKGFPEDPSGVLNIKIQNEEVKCFDLHYKYNRTEPLDTLIGISRLDSYFINYTDAPADIIRTVVEKDVQSWKKDSPNFQYKQNIMIRLSAGLGDQIESEPVARFVRKLYPDANIHLVTHHPEAFSHLKEYNIQVYDYSTWNGIEDALLIMDNNPEPGKSQNAITQVLLHPTDYSSISMIRRTLPVDEKQIKLPLDINAVDSVLNLLKGKVKDKRTVVVSPGKWWPSKTFPKKWWQEVVDGLSEKLTVVLIGKTLSEEQGYVDVECPKDGFDFRDYTSLGENLALISLSKVTLSNCSSPIHMAGGFDNWIVLIPSSKHPDHVLPWRNGTQRYRTKVLYKRLLVDDLELRHTEFDFDTIDKIPKGKKIEDYLPDPKQVIQEIFSIYGSEE
jgi:ADP-heptose:LPS heptosyltransferase